MLKPQLENPDAKKECMIDKDFNFLESDESLSIWERGQYMRDLMKDIFDEGSDYNREAYKSFQFGRQLADSKKGVRFFLNPGLYQNAQGSPRELTEFYGDDKYGTGYYATPERSFLLVRQANTFEVVRQKTPHFFVRVTECSIIAARNNEKILVSHIGMSYRHEVKGLMDYLKKEGFADKDIVVIASVGAYQEEMKKRHGNDRIASVEEYEDLGVMTENIMSFEHELVRDGDDNVHRNTTEVVVADDFIYKYSYDHRNIGGWFGMRGQNEKKLVETEAGMEEREFWDEEVVEW